MSLLSRLTAAVVGTFTATQARGDTAVTSNDSRFDSLINALSGLGGEGDKGQAGRWEHSQPLTEHELDAMYRDNWIARRIVEELPYDCTRLGWQCEVVQEDGDADTPTDPFRELFSEWGVATRLRRAMEKARLKGGAAVVLGFDDGQEMDEPLRESDVTGLSWSRVADAYELSVIEWETDPKQPNYAEPRLYQYSPSDGAGTKALRVHRSRLLVFQGPERPKWNQAELPGWGDSVLQQARHTIERFEGAEQGIGHLLHEYETGVLTVAGLQNNQVHGGSSASEKMLGRMGLLNKMKSVTRMLVLGEGETFSRSTSSMTGISDARDRLAGSVAGAAHMPVTRLFGQAPSGLSTDDKSGTRLWDDYVEAHQRQHLEPAILRLCEIVIAAGLVDAPESASVEVHWTPLRTPTDKERAETRKLDAEADQIHFGLEVLDPDEIRAHAYASGGYTSRRGVLSRQERERLAAENADLAEARGGGQTAAAAPPGNA
jgi:phage-related protein (TIGR01555 family)